MNTRVQFIRMEQKKSFSVQLYQQQYKKPGHLTAMVEE